jgi:hypothetical protein
MNIDFKKHFQFNNAEDSIFYKIDSLDFRYSINKKGLIWDYLTNKPIYPVLINKRFF